MQSSHHTNIDIESEDEDEIPMGEQILQLSHSMTLLSFPDLPPTPLQLRRQTRSKK